MEGRNAKSMMVTTVATSLSTTFLTLVFIIGLTTTNLVVANSASSTTTESALIPVDQFVQYRHNNDRNLQQVEDVESENHELNGYYESEKDGRGEGWLQQVYNFGVPQIFYCDDSASWVLRFDVSDYLQNEQFSYSMWSPETRSNVGGFGKCGAGIIGSNDITNNTYLVPGMVFDNIPNRGDGWGYRQVAFYLEADSNTISSSDIYFTPEEQGDDPEALPYVHFCTTIYLRNDDGLLINWIDIEYMMFMQLSNVGFYPDTRKLLFNSQLRDRSIFQKEGYTPLISGLIMDDEDEDKANGGTPVVQEEGEVEIVATPSLSPSCDNDSDETIMVPPSPSPTRGGLSSSQSLKQRQRRRKLLRCFDGFDVVFGVGIESVIPTISPAPTSPTTSPAPTPAGFVVNPPDPLDFTSGTASVNADEYYNVIGYICDDNLQPLSEEQLDAGYFGGGQGNTFVKVCVERNEKCVRDSVYLRHIDAFSFFQGNDRQVAVKPINTPADNGFTTLQCERGSEKCYFETFLIASMFKRDMLVTGSGAATLQFGSSSSTNNRHLRGGGNGDGNAIIRTLQEDNDNLEKTRGFNFAFILPSEEKMKNIAEDGNNKGGEEKREKKLKAIMICILLLLSIMIAFFMGDHLVHLKWKNKNAIGHTEKMNVNSSTMNSIANEDYYEHLHLSHHNNNNNNQGISSKMTRSMSDNTLSKFINKADNNNWLSFMRQKSDSSIVANDGSKMPRSRSDNTFSKFINKADNKNWLSFMRQKRDSSIIANHHNNKGGSRSKSDNALSKLTQESDDKRLFNKRQKSDSSIAKRMKSPGSCSSKYDQCHTERTERTAGTTSTRTRRQSDSAIPTTRPSRRKSDNSICSSSNSSTHRRKSETPICIPLSNSSKSSDERSASTRTRRESDSSIPPRPSRRKSDNRTPISSPKPRRKSETPIISRPRRKSDRSIPKHSIQVVDCIKSPNATRRSPNKKKKRLSITSAGTKSTVLTSNNSLSMNHIEDWDLFYGGSSSEEESLSDASSRM